MSRLPTASPDRQVLRQDLEDRIRRALGPLAGILGEARANEFSAPFLIEGEYLLRDRKYWHPGDPSDYREPQILTPEEHSKMVGGA
jgi:hypothetical protein